MQRILTILAASALLLMAAGVALDTNVAAFGALNTRQGGVTPQAESIATGVSAAGELGLLLLLVCGVLGVILAGQRRQWGWMVVFIALLPGATFAFLQAGFEADVTSGLASLAVPAVYLLYSLRRSRELHAG